MNKDTNSDGNLKIKSEEPTAILLTNQAKTLITAITALVASIISLFQLFGIGEKVDKNQVVISELQADIQKTTAALNKQQLEFNKKNYTLELFKYFQTMKPKLKSDPMMSKEFLALFNGRFLFSNATGAKVTVGVQIQ